MEGFSLARQIEKAGSVVVQEERLLTTMNSIVEANRGIPPPFPPEAICESATLHNSCSAVCTEFHSFTAAK